MRKLLLSAAALGGLMAATAASAQTFAFQTIDNPGDPTFNQLLGINDNGIIVGYFGSGMQVGHPNIGYEIAPPYTKFTPNMQPGSVQTQATGINNAGLTTGFWSDTNLGSGDANFGFLRIPEGKNFAYLSVVNPLSAATPRLDQALGINNSNVVAGFYADAKGNATGFTYALSTFAYTKIKISGATSTTVTGINDSGVTSGFYTTPKQTTVGFVRNASGTVVTSFTVPGTTTTELLGVNNAGVAVGTFVDGNMISHGLYYVPSTGAWTQIDDPHGLGGSAGSGTVINGINNKNQLVGFYTDPAGNTHGLLVTVTP
jgi:hypothetical protein